MIDELPEPDRAMATRLHAIIKASVPGLAPKLWYGMPAYYMDGKVVCHSTAAGDLAFSTGCKVACSPVMTIARDALAFHALHVPTLTLRFLEGW